MAILYNICPGFHISVLVLWLVSHHLGRVQEQKKNEDNPEQWKIRFNGQNEHEHQEQMGWSLWYYHFDMKTNCFPWIFPTYSLQAILNQHVQESPYGVKQWAAILRFVCLWFWIWFTTNFLQWNYTTDFGKEWFNNIFFKFCVFSFHSASFLTNFDLSVKIFLCNWN